MKPLLLPLNKSAPAIYTALFSILLFYIFPKSILSLYQKNNSGWIMIAFFEFCLLSGMLWFVFKRLIPALKGTTGLELNENYLYYSLDDVKVEWQDIKNIELKTGKITFISIQLNNPVIGSTGFSPLWIVGSNEEVYDVVNEYWEKYKSENSQ